MKTITAIYLVLLTAISAGAERFKVQVPFGEEFEGTTTYLYDYGNGTKVDSTIVKDKVAVFKGDVDEPYLAMIVAGEGRSGKQFAPFVLEGGSISFNAKDQAFGSMLNDSMRQYLDSTEVFAGNFRKAVSDSERQAIYNSYLDFNRKTMSENADNPISLFVFLQDAGQLDGKGLRAVLSQYPSLGKYERVKKILERLEMSERTQPGKKFVDFEISYDGKTSRLSDYVGKGKYTLVDFWASWCGPCMRQAAVLKDIYNEYHDKGLDVLGVAVWDEPENTRAAIRQHGLPWPNILNAQSIPTDLYGISGIPCIILFGPDGTIISRDKQGDELKADVRAAMEGQTVKP